MDGVGVAVERIRQRVQRLEDPLSCLQLAIVGRCVGCHRSPYLPDAPAQMVGASPIVQAIRHVRIAITVTSQPHDLRSGSPWPKMDPMRQSIRLGTYRGIPVGAHWSVVVIFGLVAWELADGVFPGSYPGTPGQYWLAALVAAVLFFGSLLAHEVSHAIVARRNGVAVNSITLWLFGGVAQLGGEALSPGADFRIAAVGPGVSLALVGFFAVLARVLEGSGVNGLIVAVPSWLWRINLLLAAFNLIPAAPLDGGRILRAGIWLKSNRNTATMWAARVGRVFGMGLVALSVALFLRYRDPSWLWPAFIGWFLFAAARAEENYARVRGGLEGLRVGDVMTEHPPALASSTTVADLVHRHLPWYRVDAVALVGPTGWLDGILTLDRIGQVPPLAYSDTPIGSLAYPIGTVPVGRPEEPLQELLQRMSLAKGLPAVILDASNRLAGIVTPAGIEQGVKNSAARNGRS
jgi:Zn-dependent protease